VQPRLTFNPSATFLRIDAVLHRVNARGSGFRISCDAQRFEPSYHGALESADRVANAQPRTREVDQCVHDELARAVVGDLSATIDLECLDAIVAQQMFAPAGKSQRIDR
jgi:hypothetical protein